PRNTDAERKQTFPATARIAQSLRPAASSSLNSSPASLSAKGARISASASEPIVFPSATASAANPGERSISRQTITTTRPPGTSTRFISRKAPLPIRKELKPELTADNVEAPVGKRQRLRASLNPLDRN